MLTGGILSGRLSLGIFCPGTIVTEADDLEISESDHLMTPVMKMKMMTRGTKQRAIKHVIRSNKTTT